MSLTKTPTQRRKTGAGKGNRNGRAQSGPTSARDAELQLKIMQLRRASFTLEAIGQQVGLSKQAVHQRVMKGLEEVYERTDDEAKALRAEDEDRLNGMMVSYYPLAIGSETKDPDPVAAAVVLKLMERRAKLRGLDAPTRVTTPKDQPFELAAVQAATSAPTPALNLANMSKAELTAAFVQAIRGHDPPMALPAPRRQVDQ